MNAIVRRLTPEDVEELNTEGLNGMHLIEDDYYKIVLVDDPSVYCYARDFCGLEPEEITEYLYIEKSDIIGNILRIDYAAIKNDEKRYPPITINVKYADVIDGEGTRIYKDESTGKHYMRISSYPREFFAKWMTAFKKQGRWVDGSEIRANVIFSLDGQTEKVTYTNWNGPAVYSDNFNEYFEK